MDGNIIIKKGYRRALRAIAAANGVVNFAVLAAILALFVFAGYALWDSNQVYGAADKENYAVYKPDGADGGKSFEELRRLNPEVFAWLSLYGTNIDYPVVQGPDNIKYVNTNAEGRYALSGAIFLDAGNHRDFGDFNNVVYGHHMEQQKMFGEIGDFAERSVFDAHRYGNLYYDGRDHGVEFFLFLRTDAYDDAVFAANVEGGAARLACLDELYGRAEYSRDIGPVTADDRLLILTTCSSMETNGRDVLVGRITDEAFADPFPKEEKADTGGARALPDGRGGFWEELGRPGALIAILAAVIAVCSLLLLRERRRERDNKSGARDG